jgi:hypothetical protein
VRSCVASFDLEESNLISIGQNELTSQNQDCSCLGDWIDAYWDITMYSEESCAVVALDSIKALCGVLGLKYRNSL